MVGVLSAHYSPVLMAILRPWEKGRHYDLDVWQHGAS